MVTDNRNGRCRLAIIIRNEQVAAVRNNAERGEYVPVTYSARNRLAASAVPCLRTLNGFGEAERGDLFELRRCSLQSLVQRKGKKSPAAMAAFGGCVVAVSNPVQPRRIRDGQRSKHHGVNRREDCGRTANAQRAREYNGGCEHGRRAKLLHSRANRCDQSSQ